MAHPNSYRNASLTRFAKTETLMGNLRTSKALDEAGRNIYARNCPPDQKWLLGFAIAPFDPSPAWDKRRMTAFIEAAILGLDVGKFTFCEASGDCVRFANRWIIDGRRRLEAVAAYFNDEIPAFDQKWSETKPEDREHFLNYVSFDGVAVRIDAYHVAPMAWLEHLRDRLNSLDPSRYAAESVRPDRCFDNDEIDPSTPAPGI